MDAKRRRHIEARIAASLRLAWFANAEPPPDTDGMTVEEMRQLVERIDAESAMLERVTAAKACRRRGNGR